MSRTSVVVGMGVIAMSLAAASCSDSGGFDGRGDPNLTGKDAGDKGGDKRDGAVAPPIGSDGGGSGDSGSSDPDAGCGFGCTTTKTGAGTDNPFDLDNPSDHVGLDPDGALVIQRDGDESQELIWVANTLEGTVSKIDTNALEELARYEVPIDWSIDMDENGPSRTSVDSEGNVYVGARLGATISKISAAGEDCPDTSGDGTVTTSTGPADILPLGDDDCVLWTTTVDVDARGVAVQEIPTRFEIEMSPDGEPEITEIPGARYVWVGGHANAKLFKLDAETGEILLTLVAPALPSDVYGLALDGRGNLWLSGRSAEAVGRVDTTRCVDDTCNMETPCVTVCNEASCPDTCDDEILERVEVGQMTYGVTVDCAQRVWIGGAHDGSAQNGVIRYDPLAPADMRFIAARGGATGVATSGANGINGIAADASGWVWAAGGGTGVWRIDAETMQFAQVAGTGGAEFNAKGMAIDRQGRVWAIPLRDDYAMVITPGVTINDATVDKPTTLTPFVGPYTYSDMSGEQRRLAANEPGKYSQRFTGCEGQPTKWNELSWDVTTPAGTFVVFRVRSADTRSDLNDAEWIEVAGIPGRDSPLQLMQFFEDAEQTTGHYVEVEVQLFTTKLGEEGKCESVPASTPRVKEFGVSFICDTVPQ